ncbi:hypothetical protein CVT24_009948 [Panaeolus cyanescens]|uniref:Uncharacterized protein n=1 Tax=Panaeolus cyanescens TaxID=181874 RepID=A0A409VXN2_9AGAR|nr:hypothetical protein CVT24_009948 [Panaeolus cyanescens]
MSSSEPMKEPSKQTKNVLKAYHEAVNNPELEPMLNEQEAAAVSEVRAARTQEEWLAAIVSLNKALETRVPANEILKDKLPAEGYSKQVSS